MACVASNKVLILAGDSVTRKAIKQTHTKTGQGTPTDLSLTVSSEPNKVSHFRYKATDGQIYRANHSTKP